MSFKIIILPVLVVFMLGVVRSQDIDPEEAVKKFKETLGSNNGTLEEAYKALKEKCRKVAGDDWESSYDTIMTAKTTMESCIKTYVNVEEVVTKVKEAMPQGKIDEVFKEYCQRKAVLLDCFTNFTSTLRPCLRDTEQANLKIVHNITAQLANFICYKDGDRIALFIAEKGPECFSNNTEAIQQCTQKHTADKGITLDALNTTINNTDIQKFFLSNLEFDAEACHRMDEVQSCIVTNLKTCNEPTPFNIADSLLNFIRKGTPCSARPVKVDTSANARTSDAARSVRAGLLWLSASLVSLVITHVG